MKRHIKWNFLTLFVCLLFICGAYGCVVKHPEEYESPSQSNDNDTVQNIYNTEYTISDLKQIPFDSETISNIPTSTESVLSTDTMMADNDSDTLSEKDIYSYLQGIKSYQRGYEWSGSWSEIEAGGQIFSQFGCGICCLSNMYSTLKGTECPPDEMYELAKEYSDYNPESGVGALSWYQLKSICNSLDMEVSLEKKPETYAEFQSMAASNTTIMVLVSSSYDDAIWKDLPGHYVNLWLYDENTDQAFLSDSKGPSTNRTYVNLSDIYHALKTASDYQILLYP